MPIKTEKGLKGTAKTRQRKKAEQKDETEALVENALLLRALGFTVDEETYQLQKNADTGEPEMVLTKRTCKPVLPCTTAQVFWLKNRHPERWRDRRELAGDEEEGQFEITLSDEARRLGG